MVPIKYLGQLVFDKCLPLPKRIFFLMPLQHLMDTAVAFVEPCLLEAWNSLVIQNLSGLWMVFENLSSNQNCQIVTSSREPLKR